MAKQTLSVGANPEVEIERVGGDLAVVGWERADLEAQGDGLQIDRDGKTIRISGGDLRLSIPRSASLTVRFVGGNVKLENLDGTLEVSFIGGDAILRNLTGQVSLNGLVGGDTRLENFSKVSVDVHKKGMGLDNSERIRRKIDQAPRRAQEKIRHAEIKMQNVAGKAQRHAQVRRSIEVGRSKWNATPGSGSTAEALQPVSDEERMIILKMLQDKKITAEEAEKLLAALEAGA